jgi:hypothetical protein
MLGMLLLSVATVSAVATGLVVRTAMRGAIGHRIEDMGRLIGG